MKRGMGVLVLMALVCSMSSVAYAEKTRVIEKTFDRVESLRVETILGDCMIKQGSGDGISIRVEYTYEDDEFEAKFKERNGTLYVEEDLDGDDIDGDSQWLIEVPAGIEIRFESATGGLEIEGVTGEMECSSGTGGMKISGFKGELEVSSSTGSIKVFDCEGEFDLSSGTGSVTVENATGIFEASSGTGSVIIEGASGDIEASSGTGNVKAHDLSLEDFGEFNSGTGSAFVELPKGKAYELSVSSGTGKAELDCAGNDLNAYVEMTAKKRKGKISSSFDFEDEEEFYQGDDEYVRKSFTKGSGDRKIDIGTGTGKAKLKK